MRYVIKRERTGKVGRCEYDHRVIIFRSFSTYNDALAAMRSRREEFKETKFNVKMLGPDNDYYVVFSSKELDCTDRYWIETGRSETELLWWMY